MLQKPFLQSQCFLPVVSSNITDIVTLCGDYAQLHFARDQDGGSCLLLLARQKLRNKSLSNVSVDASNISHTSP